MPGGMPDLQRVQRNAQVVFTAAGETATLRTQVSTFAGAPRFGVAEGYTYFERLITGLFYTRQFHGTTTEQRPGGQVELGQQYIAAPFPIKASDQLIWRGSAWRVEGAPFPEHIGGRAQWHSPIALAQATG